MKYTLLFLFTGAVYANSPVNCLKAAMTLKDNFNATLPQRDALYLCAGSYDLGPVDCFKSAMEHKDALGNSLTTKDGIFLCSRKLVNPI